jgi:hypothetical protein
MVTRYWKTLKTAENLAQKPDLTIGICLNLAKLFVGGVMKFHEICKNLQKNIPRRKNLGAILRQFAREKIKFKRLGAGSPTNGR